MLDKILANHPDKAEVAEFWEGVVLPHQDEDDEVQFTNPVTTAEWFAKKTATIAELSGVAELLEEEIANLHVHLRRAEYDLSKLKRSILSKYLDDIAKSAKESIQEAFILRMAEKDGKLNDLTTLEDKIEDIKRRIEVREPRRDQIYARLKSLKDSQESARHYLDYAKLEKRIEANAGGRGL